MYSAKFLRIIVASFVLVVCIGFLSHATAQEADNEFGPMAGGDLTDWRISQQTATINSWDSLDEYLKEVDLDESPLNALSPKGLEAFLDGIEFTELGVSTVEYQVLERELTATEAYRILALFGAESLTSQFKNLRVQTDLDRQIMDRET